MEHVQRLHIAASAGYAKLTAKPGGCSRSLRAAGQRISNTLRLSRRGCSKGSPAGIHARTYSPVRATGSRAIAAGDPVGFSPRCRPRCRPPARKIIRVDGVMNTIPFRVIPPPAIDPGAISVFAPRYLVDGSAPGQLGLALRGVPSAPRSCSDGALADVGVCSASPITSASGCQAARARAAELTAGVPTEGRRLVVGRQLVLAIGRDLASPMPGRNGAVQCSSARARTHFSRKSGSFCACLECRAERGRAKASLYGFFFSSS